MKKRKKTSVRRSPVRRMKRIMPVKRSPAGIPLKTMLIVILCIALLTVGAILLFFSLYAIYKVYEIDMDLEIAANSAFNADEDMLNFGKAAPGNSNQRTIVMSHHYHKPLLVHFKASGNITQFITLPADFYLEPDSTREIAFTAVIPDDEKYGHFSGTLRVYFRRI
ncbi:hypothetical protein KY362_06275 [Candidatus Woesearchaeota archaeon]|nr:hypothetical protein [Candidatus Woesearchaeota archaeon]